MGGADSHKDAEVRGLLAQLEQFDLHSGIFREARSKRIIDLRGG
jgi:hypothetical protein